MLDAGIVDSEYLLSRRVAHLTISMPCLQVIAFTLLILNQDELTIFRHYVVGDQVADGIILTT